MRDALQIIIAKSPSAMSEAMNCIRAIGAKSPILAQRYERVAALALSDPKATWAAEDRALIASYLGAESDSKTVTLSPIRVSTAERDEIKCLADAADMSVSEYVRQAVLGLL